MSETDRTTPERPDQPERDWVARTVLPGGTEPDPRFTLANERTFLAWIRTSLAFLAGGIGLEAFAGHLFDDAVRRGLAVSVVAVGMLISLGAVARWRRTELNMRHGRPLTVPLIIPLLSVIGVAASVAVIVFLVTG
ncbi:YidH family protein [Corynebacterium bovis]|uniref:DUF202 domain-containing protein n=1 Tax=Corynebacterium bovis TaxID=36808 RepID=A0A426Q537_9CORY|nr:DUF202 domain-containing protein [Corynebacterium bovis]RRO92986.1 hypothetical protein CXF40_02215 [Corynebacterium bovis]RRO98122.1 hypothetical protein CXF32_02000 [Corynebacterium bovis]RRO99874.1 hypothetical protein CXF31_01780 [Corynebacterium bovis]RRQ02181.1 hypothetical protein CXF41_01610 [Corynebacterium bovis]RRQ04258.1 hypothetical protein CXF42_05005 [Corynebacterium bovis]